MNKVLLQTTYECKMSQTMLVRIVFLLFPAYPAKFLNELIVNSSVETGRKGHCATQQTVYDVSEVLETYCKNEQNVYGYTQGILFRN